MPGKKSSRDAWKASLEKIASDAHAAFPEHDGKLTQLDAAFATAAMCIDDMHDYPPYVLPST